MSVAPAARRSYGFLISGEDVSSASGKTFESINPTTGSVLASLAAAGGEDVDGAVQSARRAFAGEAWRSLSPTRRGRLMMRWGDLIAEHAEELAVLETQDNGKLYREMLAQLQTIPEWLYYFGGLADKIEGRVIPQSRSSVLNYTLREPLGVVGLIVPWNSPVLLMMYGLAPALAAGNTAVVKPSEHASISILDTVRLATEAGFPPGVVNVVTGEAEAGSALVAHDDVAKIAFTGSDAIGRVVARDAGKRLAGTTLELGGKSANILFADADPEAAAAGLLAGIFGAAGQTCVAGSRALVHRKIFDDIMSRIESRTKAIKLGDPMDASTQMGPIANRPQLERVERMVDAAQDEGAAIVVGGSRASLPELPGGFFYEPTVLSGITNASTIAQEEVFGPVLGAIPFADEAEAVELANATRYGLAAGIWTRDVSRAHRVARQLEAGTVWINMYRAVTYNSPFGGYKASGIGRVNGAEAVDGFLQTKSVWCELSDEVQDPFVLRV